MSPNRNYEAGRRAEYKVANSLRRQGFDIVARSAGSHSPVDIWAVNIATRTIRLVQVKAGKSADKERDKVKANIESLSGMWRVEGVTA